MNRIGLLTFVFVILFSNAFAIEVVDLNPGDFVISDLTPEEQDRFLALTTRIASLENKILNLASKADVEKQTEFIFNNLLTAFTNKTDILMLASAMLNVFSLILAFSLYFYLKGKGRI